jgi:hypothetical protein
MKSRISSNGAHLFDRLLGLNILLDEFHPRDEPWSISLRQVSIVLTNISHI